MADTFSKGWKVADTIFPRTGKQPTLFAGGWKVADTSLDVALELGQARPRTITRAQGVTFE